MADSLDLSGKVALITGASSGIGAATAELFASLGAPVAIGYHRNTTGADATRDRIAKAGGTVIAIEADVRVPADIDRLVRETTSALGPIDILVNNAGSLVERFSLADATEAKLQAIFTLNLTSAVLAAKAVAPSMIAKRAGAIVNVVSIAGHTGGGPGAGAYASAKAALTAYTKSMAKELAPYGVRVNGIAPGVIDTPFHEVFSTPAMITNFIAQIPIGRLGTPIECARVIAFLASPAASYIVGETVEVNGGQLMR